MTTTRTRIALLTVGLLAATACLDQRQMVETEAPKPIVNSPPLPSGAYDVQSVSYDDATGQYRVFVLGAPEGTKPLYASNDIRMARLSDEELQSGKRSRIEFGEGAPSLHLTPDFKIEYVHNVTEERVDPATGRAETVIVRQETSSWSPFMSAMAGVAIGNMLFAPRYYYPPPYAAGPIFGYGSVGPSREIAHQEYRQKFGAEPRWSKLSRTGMSPRHVQPGSLKPSGSGAGASRWRGPSKPSMPSRPRGFGFGGRRR